MIKKLVTKINFQENKILFLLAGMKLLIHLITGWQYGYFRDELYYFSMSKHLDYGYVDVSPIVPWLMRLSRLLFGNSVFAFHILPAIAGAITVIFAGLIARKFGGGRFAVAFTAVAVIAAPMFQIFNAMFTYDCFDQVTSVIFIYILVCIFSDQNNKKLWIYFGIAAGIGLMVKISLMFLGFSLLVALIISKQRKQLLSKWFWIGGGIAFLIVLPYIIWQVVHGGIIIDYWKNYAAFKTFKASPLSYIFMEAVAINPLAVPLWLTGLYFLLFSKKGGSFRVLGLINLIYLTLAAFMSFKFYILAGSFFAVLAAGAVWFEGLFDVRKLKVLKYTYTGALLTLGLAALVITVPVLPVDKFISLSDKALGVVLNNVKAENVENSELPQHFSDRFGWEEIVKAVAEVYNGLDKAEREKCGIYASNYGEAGAIDLFGVKYGLPGAISGHLALYAWGPGNYTGEIMIFAGFNHNLNNYFNEVTLVKELNVKYARDFEGHAPIFLCRKPKASLKAIWPELKSLG